MSKQPNGPLIVNGLVLEGLGFQEYARREGLCDICGLYQTHEKHGRYLNVLIPLSRKNEQGAYEVYKGYCIQPTCYTLEQAQRDLGEIPSKPKRVPRNHAFPPSNKMLESPGSNSTDRIFEELERYVKQLRENDPSLTTLCLTLCLGRNSISDNGAKAIAEALKVNTVLTTLYLYENLIGINGAKAIAKALKVNTVLTTLNLSNNSIGDDGAKAITEALKDNTVLAELYLSSNSIGNNGAKAIAEALKVNTVLTTLNLRSNSIGVVGAKALAEALKVNSVMTRLHLYKNSIGDDGANAIAEALKVNSVFTTLSLSDNSIGDVGAKAIVEALKVNTVLTSLDLYGNSIGADLLNDILKLVDANKNCKPRAANTTQPISTTTNTEHPSSPTTFMSASGHSLHPNDDNDNEHDKNINVDYNEANSTTISPSIINYQGQGVNTKVHNEHIVHENLIKLMAKAQEDNESIMSLSESFEDKKSNQASVFQLPTEYQEILKVLLEKTSEELDDQEEQKAILSCKNYSDFYLQLCVKLNCMIGACEGLSSNMLAGGSKGSVRSHIIKLLRNNRVDLIKNTRIGALVANAIKMVKKELPVPGMHTIGSFFQMIVQLKESRDHWLGVANVADFSTLASLRRNSHGSFKYAVECFARIMVRALHADQTFGTIDDKFGKFKTSMLQLLAEQANTPAREKGYAVADCALAHIMKPGVGTPLYNLFDSFNIEINVHECLAANTLNMTIDEVKKLPKIQLPNAVTAMKAKNGSVLNQGINYCATDKTNVVSDKETLLMLPGSRGVDVDSLAEQVKKLIDSHAEEVKSLRNSQKQHSKRLNDALADRAKVERELDAVKKDLANMKAPPQSDGGLMYADHREAYKDNVFRNTQDIYELKDQATLQSEEMSALKNMIAIQQEDDGTKTKKQPKRLILWRKNIK